MKQIPTTTTEPLDCLPNPSKRACENETMREYLTTRDLADKTGLSISYFQQAARTGELPARRLGKGPRAIYLIPESEFLEWWQSKLEKVRSTRWQVHSRCGEKYGMGGSLEKERPSSDRSKQKVKALLEIALNNG